MNPRAAINDLHPFQGCPFSHLGYFSMHRMYALRIILMSIKVDADICRIFTAVYSIILSWRRYLQRRGWDSNPRALADKRFSRPPRYDHFDISPCVAVFRCSLTAKVILPKNLFSVNYFFTFFSIFFKPLFSALSAVFSPYRSCPYFPERRKPSAITRSSGVVIFILS